MTEPQVDHIVHLVNDLDKACADFASLGFTVQERADTKHGGTSFRFVCFADGSYILLTAYASKEAAASHRLGNILAEGEGIADYSFVVPDLEAAIARGRAAGATLGKINDVNNVVQSGAQWGLRLLVSGRGSGGDEALPFLVQDVAGRDIRIPPAVPHANGATGIAALTVGAADPVATAKILGALLDAAVGPGDDGAQVMQAGPTRVQIVPNSEGLPGRRAAGGLASIRIHTSKQQGAGPLDLALAHGGQITLLA